MATRRGEGFLYRWRERRPDGSFEKRSQQLGLVADLKTEAQAWKVAERLRVAANPGHPGGQVHTFGTLCERFMAEEMTTQRLSTRTFALPWFRNHIIPKWADYPISDVKPFAVRQWLRELPLRKKSKQHIRSLMKQVCKMAMLWEIIDIQVNPMSLVSIQATPDEETIEKRVLTPAEFQTMMQLIPEP
jgi:hypothetical protein